MSEPGQIGLDFDHVHRAFERAAPVYAQNAVLQQEVEQRLMERLEYLHDEPARVLELGCGAGTASHAFQQRYPGATVIGLDRSPAMLQQLMARAGNPRPQALCADMQAIPLPARSMDLIFSSLAVEWSPDPPGLFSDMRRVLKPGGMMLFSTLGPDTLHELRSAWMAVDEKPHVNQFIDMHDIGDMVVAAGFNEPVFDVDILTVEYRDVKNLMHDLKAGGAQNAAINRFAGLTGKDKFARVLEAYEKFRREEVYPATFEVIYGVAFGPPEGQPFRTKEGELASFSIDALKASRTGSQT